MKRPLVAIVLIFLTAAVMAQTGIRPIGSVQWDVYFNSPTRQELTGRTVERNVFDINLVSIFPFTSLFSLELKGQFQATTWVEPGPEATRTLAELVSGGLIGEDWWKLTVSPAAIIVTPPFYFIIRPAVAFGNGLDSTGERITVDIAPEGTIDANLETRRWYANATFRGAYYREQGIWFIIPSGGATHLFRNGFRLGGKVFYSFTSNSSGPNTVETTELATLVNTEFPLNERTRLLVGGTLAWTPVDGNISNNDYDGTLYVGISLPATDSVRLKYQLEPIIRGNAGLGLSNVFVMDARL